MAGRTLTRPKTIPADVRAFPDLPGYVMARDGRVYRLGHFDLAGKWREPFLCRPRNGLVKVRKLTDGKQTARVVRKWRYKLWIGGTLDAEETTA